MLWALRLSRAAVVVSLLLLALCARGDADIPAPGNHGITKYWPAARAYVTNFSPFAYDGRITALTPDRAGGVWFGAGSTAERIERDGRMHDYAVSDSWLWAVSGFSYDPAGRLWFSLGQSGRIGTVDASGAVHTQIVVPRRDFPNLRTIAFDKRGSLWFEDTGRDSIGVRTRNGVFRERPLPAGGTPWAMTVCNGRAWVVSSAEYGRWITLYKVAGLLDRFQPIRQLPNGWPSLACDAKGNVWYASAVYQGKSRIDIIDVRGDLRERELPLWNARVYGAGDGSIWVAGLNQEYSSRRGQLVIARVGDNARLVAPRMLPWRVNFDYSLAVTDPRTAWINLAFPHSVMRMRFVDFRLPRSTGR